MRQRLLRPVREVAKTAVGTVNRWLHPLRRRRAIARVERAGLPKRVVFVCHGNICRSPYAEGALRRELSPAIVERIQLDSAGFIRPGRRSPEAAVEAAKERSVDLSDHRSRALEPDSLGAGDFVLVMEPGQRRTLRRRFPSTTVMLLGDLDPEPSGRRRILDPVEQPIEVFRTVYERIDRCVGTLTRAVDAPISADPSPSSRSD